MFCFGQFASAEFFGGRAGRPGRGPEGGQPCQAGDLVNATPRPDHTPTVTNAAGRSSGQLVEPGLGEANDGRPGRRSGRLRVALGVLVILPAAYYLATLAQVVRTGGEHDAGPADAIVVLGAAQYDGRPSPQLAARLDHVVTLWRAGVAPLVVVTGGNRPGDRFTEAEASARYLEGAGIPAEAVIEVGAGTTTHESIAAAAPVMAGRGIESVALVTDPYHALRSRLIVEAEGFDVDVATTPMSVVTGGAAWRRNLQEAAGVAAGRVIGFGRLSELTG